MPSIRNGSPTLSESRPRVETARPSSSPSSSCDGFRRDRGGGGGGGSGGVHACPPRCSTPVSSGRQLAAGPVAGKVWSTSRACEMHPLSSLLPLALSLVSTSRIRPRPDLLLDALATGGNRSRRPGLKLGGGDVLEPLGLFQSPSPRKLRHHYCMRTASAHLVALRRCKRASECGAVERAPHCETRATGGWRLAVTSENSTTWVGVGRSRLFALFPCPNKHVVPQRAGLQRWHGAFDG